MKEASIEEKVDLLINGMKIPRKRTRRRVATMATSLLISIVLIASASLIGFYVQIDGDVTVEHLLTLDGQPALEIPIIETSVNVVPGCTSTDGTHSIALNLNYDAQFTIYFHIEITETLSDGVTGDGEGLLVEIWDITSIPQTLMMGTGEGQIPLDPGQSKTFEIRVTADIDIDSTSTYGYIITMDGNGT